MIENKVIFIRKQFIDLENEIVIFDIIESIYNKVVKNFMYLRNGGVFIFLKNILQCLFIRYKEDIVK